MAHWRKNEPKCEEIERILTDSPGISARELARRINCAPSTIIRCLPSLEEMGLLLAEDDDGLLWPFRSILPTPERLLQTTASWVDNSCQPQRAA